MKGSSQCRVPPGIFLNYEFKTHFRKGVKLYSFKKILDIPLDSLKVLQISFKFLYLKKYSKIKLYYIY